MEFVGTAKFSELYGVKHKLLLLIHVLIQRRSIKKVNQPRSQKNTFANVNCCNHKYARNLTHAEGRTTNNEKQLVCKRRKFQPRRPLTLCIAFLRVQKCYTGLGPEKIVT